MNATGFKLGNYTSRRTGEVSKKIMVKFDNGQEYFLWLNKSEFDGKTTEEAVDIIKKDRDNYLNQVVVSDTQYGLQAQFEVLTDVEEF